MDLHSASWPFTSPTAPRSLRPTEVVVGGGEMGELIRSFDWSRTGLGPIERWPQSLRSALSILLPSRAQIALFWGEDLITLYNDAYRPVFGAKHPQALGQPIRESWEELWRAGLKEIFDGVLATGEAFWARDRPFFMERHGYLEETYFDVSYDPVRDESGRVGGVFCIVNETTGRVIGERRLHVLRDLGHLGGRRIAEVYPAAMQVLAQYAQDLPFVLCYVPAEDGMLRLAAGIGLPADSPAAPPLIDPAAPDAAWRPANELAIAGPAALARFGVLHAGPWPERIGQVVMLPCAVPGESMRGLLVCGISPRLALDDAYLDFLRLVEGNLAAALAGAHRVEDEHRRAEMLAEIDRAKTTFFSNVSHELRTPLTLMLGPLEELLGMSADAAQRQMLGFVQRNTLRLLKLVNTLLDFARLEAGRIRASFRPTDLCVLTRELASNFRSAIEKAGLAFRVDCRPLREAAFVDREMWEKIVLNLLSNAYKFTWQGRIELLLEEGAGGVRLVVRDTGTGIPASELPHLFERFHRVPNAQGRSNEGTGIGLALVHELVRLHGGRIDVHSEEGRGTAFTVTLPFGRAHLPAEQVVEDGDGAAGTSSGTVRMFLEELGAWRAEAGLASLTEETAPRAAAQDMAAAAGRARIMLADDNADMREYLRHLLGTSFDVTTACDGAEALAVIRAQRPDLVVADVMMPRLDGVELLRALRAEAATLDIPVILLSARAGEEARLEGLQMGADDYLVKPFNARELFARVQAQIRLAGLRKEAQRMLQEAKDIRWRVANEQLRLQRDELQRIFHNTPSFMALVSGPELVFELANPAYQALVGRREVLGKRLVDALPEIAEQPYPDILRRVLQTGEPFVGRELPVTLHREGEQAPQLRYVDFVFMPIYEENAAPAVLVEGSDVTDRVLAQQQLERENRRKDEFIATLAHELRNPLAALSSAAQLLMRGSQAPAVFAVARDALARQIDIMSRLLDDLLDLARVTHGRVQLRRSVFPLREAILAAIETSRPLFESRRHGLAVEESTPGIHVDADRVRIAQVFSNLLTNAAKYTDAGGDIRLRIEARDGRAIVTVADNGIGLAAENLQRVFEMFSQSKPALERSEGGLGIGLALVKGLVELHGGSVEARSPGIGHGSTFIVSLPLADAPAAQVGGHPAGSGAVAAMTTAQARKVLIADDNRDGADSWALLLQLEGFQTQVAYSGEEALRLAARFAPDIVLLDIGLPGMNGYEVARELRATPAGARCLLIAMTGWGQAQDRQAALAAGFDAHLTKPVQLAQILELFAAPQQRSRPP